MSTKTDKTTMTIIGISGIVIAVFACIVAVRFLFGGSEDTWICSGGTWVMHGKPTTSRPTTLCAE